jgi:uncharacterized protein
MLAFCFGVVSLLYATVGQAGGTAFLALMAFASFPPREMRPTALLLNIIAATYSTLVFSRGKHIDWSKLKILLISSLPAAFAGGFIALDERIYRSVAGVVLLLAAIIVVFRRSGSLGADHAAPLSGSIVVGAGTGFVSGLTGVGGGVFLAPILIGLHWASPKQTSAMSAPFILANSFVGLIGRSVRRSSARALYMVICDSGACRFDGWNCPRIALAFSGSDTRHIDSDLGDGWSSTSTVGT